MKKLSLLLVIVLLMSALAGCGGSEETPETTSPAVFVTVPALEGEPAQVDVTDMTEYVLDSGISFYGPGGLKEKDVDGMAAYLDSGFFLLMVIEEPKAGGSLENTDLEGYAEMLTTRNNLNPCVIDRYGNLATTYVAKGITGETVFFYYVTLQETADSFLMVQMLCPGEVADLHVDSMAQWSSTVKKVIPEE